jgi:outer membrane immunogenic protein
MWGNHMRKLLVASIAAAAFCGAPAIAADMPTKAPVYKAVDPGFNWTGFYAGLNAGYGSADMSSTFTSNAPGFTAPSLSANGNGFIGGAQVGYNWQNARFIAGLEADLTYSGIRGKNSGLSTSTINTTTIDQKIPWFGTARGRLGFLATDKFLIFATGGLAVGETKATSSSVSNLVGAICGVTVSCAFSSVSHTSATWTVGGGFEYAFSPQMTWKVEYLYFNFGSESVTAPISLAIGGFVTAKSNFQATNIFRTGLNWRW